MLPAIGPPAAARPRSTRARAERPRRGAWGGASAPDVADVRPHPPDLGDGQDLHHVVVLRVRVHEVWRLPWCTGLNREVSSTCPCTTATPSCGSAWPRARAATGT